jgi:hypothetical protein
MLKDLFNNTAWPQKHGRPQPPLMNKEAWRRWRRVKMGFSV